MKLRVHFEHKDGTNDTIVLCANDETEMRAHIDHQMKKRAATYLWSEEIE